MNRLNHTHMIVTASGALGVKNGLELEIAQWIHMRDRSYDPSHHQRTLNHEALSQSQTRAFCSKCVCGEPL